MPAPDSVQCVPGVDGKHYYAAYGLAPSIVAIPAVALTSLGTRITRRDFDLVFGLVLAMYHAFFSATVPLVFALWLCRIGISWHAAFLPSSMPVTMTAFLVLTLLAAMRTQVDRRPRQFLFLGIFL